MIQEIPAAHVGLMLAHGRSKAELNFMAAGEGSVEELAMDGPQRSRET
jgi:hypothetical protein